MSTLDTIAVWLGYALLVTVAWLVMWAIGMRLIGLVLLASNWRGSRDEFKRRFGFVSSEHLDAEAERERLRERRFRQPPPSN